MGWPLGATEMDGAKVPIKVGLTLVLGALDGCGDGIPVSVGTCEGWLDGCADTDGF